VLVTLDAAGRIARISLTLGGVGPVPVRMRALEASLAGQVPEAGALAQAAKACGELPALADPAVPAWYRQHLACVLAERALVLACARARAGAS